MRNRTYLISLVTLTIMMISVNSCKKDEGFTQVTEFERNIQNAMNDYRATRGKPALTQTFLMIDDAQSYSAKMANESVGFNTDGVLADLELLRVNVGADSSGVWVAYCEYENPDSVMNIIKSNPKIVSLVMGEFNLSAIGTAKDVNGNFYITNLLLRKR